VKHIIRPAARDDIVRQFRYYLLDQDTPAVANRFLEAVERTIDKILLMPRAGAPRHLSNEALANLRAWPVEEFEDIRVYYLAEENEVRVIRVLHGKRDILGILEHEGSWTTTPEAARPSRRRRPTTAMRELRIRE
jgi:plasmid stabilization system protein ParE